MTDLFNTVADMISKTSGIDKSKITPDANLLTDLKIDSLDFLDITYEIDKKYGISIPVEEWVEEANSNSAGASDIFTLHQFLQRIQQLIDKKQA